MKKLEERSTEELSVLTDEAIEKLVQLEVAEQGVAFAVMPDDIFEMRMPIEKSETAYKVGETIFANRDDAELVAKMPRLKESYHLDYYTRYLKKDEENTVRTELYYKEADVRANSQAIRQHKEKKDDHEKLLQAWTKYEQAVTHIRDEVFSRVWQARREQKEFNDSVTRFEEYKSLAEGDQGIAVRFFEKAFAGRPDLIVKVYEKLGLGDRLEAYKIPAV